MSPLMWTVLLATGAGITTALWARARLVVVNVSGQSMEPTFFDGDRVLVRRKALRAIRVGEVVVFRRPPAIEGPQRGNPWMIKRLAGVQGDQFAVLGDRPDRSFDSRHCGYLDASTLLGVVIRQL